MFDRILSTGLAVCAARIQAKEMQLLRHHHTHRTRARSLVESIMFVPGLTPGGEITVYPTGHFWS